MDESGNWTWGTPARVAIAVRASAGRGIIGALLAFLGPAHAHALDADAALESVRPRVGAVIARSASSDGGYQEETGNCLLWTVGGRTYTLADLHTLMTGQEEASDRLAEQIVVKVGRRSLHARLVWPPEGERDVRSLDIAILLLDGGIVGQPFGPEAFEGIAGSPPRELYLAAPGHRSRIIPVAAAAVAYGSQWFLDRELAHGDSGGMVFALEDGRVIPYGFVSAIGSLPGRSARGTVIYGRAAMRISIDRFLRARAAHP